jgi:phosphohistidine phosphatase
MKTLYIIRCAKSKWSKDDSSDFERSVSKRGLKDLNTITSYLALRGIKMDLILSSCALRAQQTADAFASKLSKNQKVLYLNELYLKPVESIKSLIMVQDDNIDTLAVVTHSPFIMELANGFCNDVIPKFPTCGVVALKFDVNSWNDIKDKKTDIEFFIYPNQFKYYIPKQIKGIIEL